MPRRASICQTGALFCWYRAGQCRYGSPVSPRTLTIASLFLFIAAPARAANCDGTTSLGGCFPTLGVSTLAEPGPLRTLSMGRALPFRSVAVSLNAWRVNSPAQLVAASPDPDGRTIDVVKRAHIIDLRAAAGVGRGLDVTLGLPMYVEMKGAGSDALATQKPEPLSGAALGDLQLGLRYSPRHAQDDSVYRLMIRTELTLPTGNETKYAGATGVTALGAVTNAFRYQGWSLAADLGFRAAPSVRFGDVRLGSALLFGFGLARDILDDQVLSVGVELWASRMLANSPTTDVPVGAETTVVPAEWMLNAQYHPLTLPGWVWLGGGMGIPLSSRSGATNSSYADSSFVAPSASRWRLGLGVGVYFAGT